VTTHSSNSCVSTEECFEGGYECAGILEEAVIGHLKGAIQAFIWEEKKTVEVIRRVFVSRDWNGYLWNTSLRQLALKTNRVKR
jgi:hypothetical protein